VRNHIDTARLASALIGERTGGRVLGLGRHHLASSRGTRTAIDAEDLQGDAGMGLEDSSERRPTRPRGLLEPCAGATRPHGSEEAVGAAMRPPLSDNYGYGWWLPSTS
jgi:hypothetical protein